MKTNDGTMVKMMCSKRSVKSKLFGKRGPKARSSSRPAGHFMVLIEERFRKESRRQQGTDSASQIATTVVTTSDVILAILHEKRRGGRGEVALY